MQEIPPEYWEHARRILDTGAAETDPPDSDSLPFRRLHAELSRRLDPFRAQALLQLAVGLASEALPAVGDAQVAEDGRLESRARLDGDARQALLACALGLTATLLGPPVMADLLGVVWPDLARGG